MKNRFELLVAHSFFLGLFLSANAVASDDPFLNMIKKEDEQLEKKGREENQCFRFSSKKAKEEFGWLKATQGVRGIDYKAYINNICNNWHKGDTIVVHENILSGNETQKIPVSIDGCKFSILISSAASKTNYTVETTYDKECKPKSSTRNLSARSGGFKMYADMPHRGLGNSSTYWQASCDVGGYGAVHTEDSSPNLYCWESHDKNSSWGCEVGIGAEAAMRKACK